MSGQCHAAGSLSLSLSLSFSFSSLLHLVATSRRQRRKILKRTHRCFSTAAKRRRNVRRGKNYNTCNASRFVPLERRNSRAGALLVIFSDTRKSRFLVCQRDDKTSFDERASSGNRVATSPLLGISVVCSPCRPSITRRYERFARAFPASRVVIPLDKGATWIHFEISEIRETFHGRLRQRARWGEVGANRGPLWGCRGRASSKNIEQANEVLARCTLGSVSRSSRET